MQVILLERVAKLGQMGDEVTVKDGFARNFLLPQKKAMRATEINRKYFEAERARLEADNLKRREEAEAVPASINREEEPTTTEVLGLTVSTITDELREQLGLSDSVEGLVVSEVAEDTEAFEKGLRVGDVITQAAQESVASIADLNERIDAAREAGRKSLVLLVNRNGDPRFVALNLDNG